VASLFTYGRSTVAPAFPQKFLVPTLISMPSWQTGERSRRQFGNRRWLLVGNIAARPSA
jgi:hypothetical protein